MTHEAAQAIVRRYRNVSDAELSNADINFLHREITTELIPLEFELALLRQIVADVETCRGVGVENGVTICGAAEIALVALTWPALHDDRAFEASTWQAALHAAAEHVRNTNPERTENEV